MPISLLECSGGQHAVEACREIRRGRDDLTEGQIKESSEFVVVFVWERSPHVLRRTSHVLNLRLEEKDCKESCTQQLEKARDSNGSSSS